MGAMGVEIGAMGYKWVQWGTNGNSEGQMDTMGVYGYNGGHGCKRGHMSALGGEIGAMGYK